MDLYLLVNAIVIALWIVAFLWIRSLDPSFVEKDLGCNKIRPVKPVSSTWMETAQPIPKDNPKNEFTLF